MRAVPKECSPNPIFRGHHIEITPRHLLSQKRVPLLLIFGRINASRTWVNHPFDSAFHTGSQDILVNLGIVREHLPVVAFGVFCSPDLGGEMKYDVEATEGARACVPQITPGYPVGLVCASGIVVNAPDIVAEFQQGFSQA